MTDAAYGWVAQRRWAKNYTQLQLADESSGPVDMRLLLAFGEEGLRLESRLAEMLVQLRA